jgi:antagonist of KipI
MASAIPAVRVLRPGLLTTIQDLGRWGYQSRGVSVAGPMDVFAHRRANLLVGNSRDAATLEVTLQGPELEFEDARLVAVSGAEFALTVDGRDVQPGAPIEVTRGSRLAFGVRRTGARAYVAIDGGIAVVPVLGSRSTHVPTRLGGLDGRPLAAGDRLPLGPPTGRLLGRRASVARGSRAVREPVVRVLPGPHEGYFVPEAFDALESAPYRVDVQSNRIGFRLAGPELRHSRRPEIISEPVPIGSVQVPGSGQPIVLMADRQTTGGYPKLATVISADIGVIGQLAPGDEVRLRRCTWQEALAARISQEQALLALEGSQA